MNIISVRISISGDSFMCWFSMIGVIICFFRVCRVRYVVVGSSVCSGLWNFMKFISSISVMLISGLMYGVKFNSVVIVFYSNVFCRLMLSSISMLVNISLIRVLIMLMVSI